MFKVNNKDTITLCSSVSIVNFEQVNGDWVHGLQHGLCNHEITFNCLIRTDFRAY